MAHMTKLDILIIEDDENIAKAQALILQDDYNVHIASDGEEGLMKAVAGLTSIEEVIRVTAAD